MPTPDPETRWPRPVPVIGDTTTSAERAADPRGWAHPPSTVDGLYEVLRSRRDIRRFRPDEVDDVTLRRVLAAAHAAPSVGHSQPWRFIIVRHPDTRDRAALLADRERLAQAALLDPDAAAHLLDLQLEGIREAPLGVVVCCDRRTPAAGVLGRATYQDTDLWSCACAIENLWLAARSQGLGVGWVTLFQPAELAALLGLPDGVETLGWLCVGWPDERPPEPGLQRAAWSHRLALDDVILHERWPSDTPPDAPASKLRSPDQHAVVAAHDNADTLLTTPGSLGVLDHAIDRVIALGLRECEGGTLLLAVGRHLVTEFGVSAYDPAVTDEVADATRAARSLGAAAARHAGLHTVVLDGGTSTGDLVNADTLRPDQLETLLQAGRTAGREAGAAGLVALGEVGIGNTTVAATLTAAALGLAAVDVAGRGAGADSAMVERKQAVVRQALQRIEASPPAGDVRPEAALRVLRRVGGPEFALLAGVVLGAAEAGTVVVLDGLATSISALLAVHMEPAVAAHLVAGQRSRERAHAAVLTAMGLEPLLDLRIRAGEGVGACLASSLLLQGLAMRRTSARTTAPITSSG